MVWAAIGALEMQDDDDDDDDVDLGWRDAVWIGELPSHELFGEGRKGNNSGCRTTGQLCTQRFLMLIEAKPNTIANTGCYYGTMR